MSDVSLPHNKCMFCSSELDSEASKCGRLVCLPCFEAHQREPEPTAVEIIAMDIADLQDDVIELFRRLSGERVSEEEKSKERVQRFERMLALVERALGEKQG